MPKNYINMTQNEVDKKMVDEMVKDGVSVLPGHVQIHHPDYRDDPTVANRIAPPADELLQVLDRPEVVACR